MPFIKKQYLSVFFLVMMAQGARPVCADMNIRESAFIAELRAKAEKGDPLAQYDLANSYYVGVGINKNYTDAVKWYTRAAEQGYAKAQSGLGSMYYSGLGVSKDISEALKWWRKAAEQHNADAQDQLGFAYLLGDGVRKDYIRAYMWFNIAASNNDQHAVKDRDSVAKYMDGGQISEAQQLQSEWQQRHPTPAKDTALASK